MVLLEVDNKPESSLFYILVSLDEYGWDSERSGLIPYKFSCVACIISRIVLILSWNIIIISYKFMKFSNEKF